MGKKIIITAALNGVGTTKEQTPYVPISPEEIACDAVACGKAGASIIHIHARDRDGKNTMETSRFIEIVKLVREEAAKANVDIALNLTTSDSNWPEDMRRAHLPVLKPEICSYDPGTMNRANSFLFTNSPAFLEKLGYDAQALEIKPECEIFDDRMIDSVDHYLRTGALKAPVHYQLVLGIPGGMPGNMASLNCLLSKMHSGSTWSITGIGHSHMTCMLLGLANDCDGLRVGLEDNIFMEEEALATNVSLVERAVKIGQAAGRDIATAAEARELLGLKKHVI